MSDVFGFLKMNLVFQAGSFVRQDTERIKEEHQEGLAFKVFPSSLRNEDARILRSSSLFEFFKKI